MLALDDIVDYMLMDRMVVYHRIMENQIKHALKFQEFQSR